MISAAIGVPAVFIRRRNVGMSAFVAGMYITSAAISVHARYAPSTETITPTLMKVEPQRADDRLEHAGHRRLRGRRRAPGCGSTPYESSVTSAKIASTLRNPSTVAWPTSSRFFANRE